ncbi:MAG: ATP synthase F0 subunit B [Bdellovibrionota bacterium]
MKSFSIITSLILAPSLALAAGAGHAEPVFADTIPYWLHFIAYLFLIFLLLRKPLPAAWNGRRLRIEDAVLKGERELAAAKKTLADSKAKVANLQTEVTEIKETIAKETKLEVARILEESKAQAKRVADQAKSSAEAEERTAEREVQNELAAMVIERAREILKNEVNQDSDKKYRDSAVSSVNTLLQ